MKNLLFVLNFFVSYKSIHEFISLEFLYSKFYILTRTRSFEILNKENLILEFRKKY